MNRQVLISAAFLLLVSASAGAQSACPPCVPIDQIWTATPCDTWNCAQALMILANGDPYAIAIPTASHTVKWIVFRRVAAGATTVSPESPIELQTFDSIMDATVQFTTVDANTLPMLVSTADGKILFVHLKQAERRRVVPH